MERHPEESGKRATVGEDSHSTHTSENLHPRLIKPYTSGPENSKEQGAKDLNRHFTKEEIPMVN